MLAPFCHGLRPFIPEIESTAVHEDKQGSLADGVFVGQIEVQGQVKVLFGGGLANAFHEDFQVLLFFDGIRAPKASRLPVHHIFVFFYRICFLLVSFGGILLEGRLHILLEGEIHLVDWVCGRGKGAVAIHSRRADVEQHRNGGGERGTAGVDGA